MTAVDDTSEGRAVTVSRTGSPRTARRTVLSWSALGGVVILLGVALLAISGALARATPGHLDPQSHAPAGMRAVAAVLGERGVDVVVTRSWRDAVDRASAPNTTLALTDAPALSDDALSTMFSSPDVLVLLDPRARTAALAADATLDGRGSGPVAAACDLPAVAHTGEVRFSTLLTGGDEQCFRDGAGAGMVVAEREGTTRIVLDATDLFTNDTVLNDANAALALGVLGSQPTLVWYVPNAGDTDIVDPNRSLADFAPDWVTPVMILLLLSGGAAAVWRGRRFGPLVAERLPVTVRVSETLEGRARLYARSRDTGHAALALRRASIRASGRSLGLGSRATTEAVIDAATAALGVPHERVREILMGASPSTDAELLALSDDLRRFEAALHAAVRSEGNHS